MNPDCRARTFAEQVDGLTSRRSRRTPPLARTLTSVALALAGRAGARLAGALDLTAGRSSMLRLVMALPDPGTGALTIAGIDDFASRRGRDYGTIEPVGAASPARRARKTAAVGAGESSGIGARRPKRARITGPPQ